LRHAPPSPPTTPREPQRDERLGDSMVRRLAAQLLDRADAVLDRVLVDPESLGRTPWARSLLQVGAQRRGEAHRVVVVARERTQLGGHELASRTLVGARERHESDIGEPRDRARPVTHEPRDPPGVHGLAMTAAEPIDAGAAAAKRGTGRGRAVVEQLPDGDVREGLA
jgi:hypothetical protein